MQSRGKSRCVEIVKFLKFSSKLSSSLNCHVPDTFLKIVKITSSNFPQNSQVLKIFLILFQPITALVLSDDVTNKVLSIYLQDFLLEFQICTYSDVKHVLKNGSSGLLNLFSRLILHPKYPIDGCESAEIVQPPQANSQ